MSTHANPVVRATNNNAVSGDFIDMAGERYYAISNVDRMDPFFVSVISDVDHWLFVSSTGGLTAGRVSPDTALFPYITVDKIHDSALHTGCKTIVRTRINGFPETWEPFNIEHYGRFSISRNLYKNLIGNKICFEEINHDLQLAFRYSWTTSDDYGFVRSSELENLSDSSTHAEFLDGFQNILPANTPPFIQSNSSNLVDAYKWAELDEATGLATHSLYSAITDRAEPSESLVATSVFCLGLEDHKTLISSGQLIAFRQGLAVEQESHRRGVRGAYFVSQDAQLAARETKTWSIVADLERSQTQIVQLRHDLKNPDEVSRQIDESVDKGTVALARIIANGDGFQTTAEENVSVHHYANVLFNILRGGIFDKGYTVPSRDFQVTIKNFNRGVYERNKPFLKSLPDKLTVRDLIAAAEEQNDFQLVRLANEYLPITFGRRHGDPSRPWNKFSINLKDDDGNGLLSYQGNWRDIFQNWEALVFSYPEFIESIIAKFVNASTMDGYNPYRITKQGIDWEVEEPDNPWSYIGYWGDHQIIYLQKFLEQSKQFHPDRLSKLLRQEIYSYANVPYRIRPFDALLSDPKNTVDFDDDSAHEIDALVAEIGADGKLVLDAEKRVYRVNLLEKLLVPLLCKLGNLVVDGGIWLNAQRPEWNDANNALVGQGLSMVTLCYLRRYVQFLTDLFVTEEGNFAISSEVAQWLGETGKVLSDLQSHLGNGPIDAQDRYRFMTELGQAACRYRTTVYTQGTFSSTTEQSVSDIVEILHDALAVIDHSIATNRRSDGMYHAYNLMHVDGSSLTVDKLYLMLEGQVAALSAGSVSPTEAVDILEAMFDSDIYRADQNSFMLYPDRKLPGFFDKNSVAAELVDAIPLLVKMQQDNDDRIIIKDADGQYRFDADFANAKDLKARLASLGEDYGDMIDDARAQILALYESVFHHKAFTGRSGTMFAFEGLGSIYWHMVAKLMLAAQENFFSAADSKTDRQVCDQIGRLYYRVREGIGFNKTPDEYGAFPTDPYSHTPKHAGARQPGMTGQVKEEILCRFGELGVRVDNGRARFVPKLLRRREFLDQARELRFVDATGCWQTIEVPAASLAFTWCQIPVLYQLDNESTGEVTVSFSDGGHEALDSTELSRSLSDEIFQRSGRISQLTIKIPPSHLFTEE